MHWVILGVAGLFEVMWAIGLVYTRGFTRFLPSLFTLVSMMASVYFLSLALRHLPLGTSYAVWTGIGTIGTVIGGIVLFRESLDPVRLICIGFILMGILGLKMMNPLPVSSGNTGDQARDEKALGHPIRIDTH